MNVDNLIISLLQFRTGELLNNKKLKHLYSNDELTYFIKQNDNNSVEVVKIDNNTGKSTNVVFSSYRYFFQELAVIHNKEEFKEIVHNYFLTISSNVVEYLRNIISYVTSNK